MVQKRQFRKFHSGVHYAAVVFHYMREYSHKPMHILSAWTTNIVGEPGHPVAATETGKECTIGDHDFAKFSLIASVSLFITSSIDV